MKKRLGLALVLFFGLIISVNAEESPLMYGEFVSHSEASEKGIEWYDFDKENNKIIAYGKEYVCEASKSGKCNSYYYDFESKEFEPYNKVAINAVMVSKFNFSRDDGGGVYDGRLYVKTTPDYYYSDRYVSKELKTSETKYDFPVIELLNVLSYNDGENEIKELALISVPSEDESTTLYGVFSSDGKWIIEPSDKYTYTGGNKELIKLQKENGDYVFITSPESVETISEDFASSIPYFDIDDVGATIIDGKSYYDVSYTEQPGRISPLYYYFTNKELLTPSGTLGDELIKIGSTLWTSGYEKYDCSDQPAEVSCPPTSTGGASTSTILYDLDGNALYDEYKAVSYNYPYTTNYGGDYILLRDVGVMKVFDGKEYVASFNDNSPFHSAFLGSIDSTFGFNGKIYVYADNDYATGYVSLYILYDEDDNIESIYCDNSYDVEYDKDKKIISVLKFYDKEGKAVDYEQYYDSCIRPQYACYIAEADGNKIYFNKLGYEVTEEEYKKDCVTEDPKNICKKVGDTYYGKDGRVVTLKEYDSECLENSNTGTFIVIEIIIIAAVGAAIVLRKTKILSKFRRI